MMLYDAATGSIARLVAQIIAAFETADAVEIQAENEQNQITLHLILSGERLLWDKDSGDTDELDEELKDLLADEDFEFDSELSQLTNEIADIISNLLRLLVSLRNPAPYDRFMSSEYAKVCYFEANDIAYCEAHHEKLVYGLYGSGRSDASAQSTIALSVPLVMKAVETGLKLGELDEDERKHVLQDLRPYSCLMEDCLAVGQEYNSRHEWMNHMLQKHWTSWICPYECDFYDTTDSSLRAHILEVYSSETLIDLDIIIHVGRHQVDLALFALPKIYGDDEEEEGEKEVKEAETYWRERNETVKDHHDIVNNKHLREYPSPTRITEVTNHRPQIRHRRGSLEIDSSRISRRERRLQDSQISRQNEAIENRASVPSEDNIIIKVSEGCVVDVGNIRIHSMDGGEVRVGRTGTPRAGSGRGTSIDGDERMIRSGRYRRR
ncbi:hypothetical protein NPX13_g4474 [Xylaria arbuscula]|uniref:C2H2-type domain-containing protein n=1 Tax=Xylaria arbuscula TaxID=114810 RepID=A0A9W8TM68_9PEZI|nr:hypothetical protein NPX13_g4474 [Xylaria arbuscula]